MFPPSSASAEFHVIYVCLHQNDGFKEGWPECQKLFGLRNGVPGSVVGVSACGFHMWRPQGPSLGSPDAASRGLLRVRPGSGETWLQVIPRPGVQSKLGTSGPLTDGPSRSVETEVLQLLHFLSSLLWDVHSAVTYIAAHLASDPE